MSITYSYARYTAHNIQTLTEIKSKYVQISKLLNCHFGVDMMHKGSSCFDPIRSKFLSIVNQDGSRHHTFSIFELGPAGNDIQNTRFFSFHGSRNYSMSLRPCCCHIHVIDGPSRRCTKVSAAPFGLLPAYFIGATAGDT